MQNLIYNAPNIFCQLRKGLTLITSNCCENKNDFIQKPFSYNADAIALKINLKGNSIYESLICNFKAKVEENTTFMATINSDTSIETWLNEKMLFTTIIVHKNFLKQILPINAKRDDLFEFFESKQNIKNLSTKKINPKTKIITQNILDNSYNQELRHLFLESAVLEILYTEFDDFFKEKDQSKQGIILSKSDIEAIYHAKEILEKNIKKAPSISELSRKVALNEFKLKTGFKKILNQSPYEIFATNRLKVAKKLLKESDLNINEIAKEVGYSTASNFSNAFYKCFKIRPMDLMKKRKYYY